MPRNSWTSLLDEASFRDGVSDPPSGSEEMSPALSLPPELAALQAERIALEARMAALTGRPSESSGEARRYPVTPLGERRQADEAWANQRDLEESRRSGDSSGQPSPRIRPGGAGESDKAADDEPFPLLRTGQRLIHGPALRDRLRSPVRRSGLSSAESGDAPTLLDRWQMTRDVLSTPVERNYTERRERLLSVVSGGSGDLDARAEQAREKALEARRLERQRQQADDARVMRARHRPHDLPGESP